MITRERQIHFIKTFFVLIGLYILFGMLSGLLEQLLPYLKKTSYKQDFLDDLIRDTPFRAVLMILVVAPIFEEIMFRTLLRPTHRELILFLTAWPTFFVATFIPSDVQWLVKLGFVAVLFFSLFYIMVRLIDPFKLRWIRQWLSKRVLLVLVVSSFIFGFIHINNYVEGFMIDLALFLLIVPRIIAGFVFGYIKLKNKHLGWSMAMHAANNSVPLFFLLLGNAFH